MKSELSMDLEMDPPGLLQTVYLSVRLVGTKQVRNKALGCSSFTTIISIGVGRKSTCKTSKELFR